jgi:hypothetical protein
MRPLALRWREGRWSEVRVPDPPCAEAALADVEILPSGHVWAVGSRSAGGRMWPYAIEYADGWRRREPSLDAQEGALTALASDPEGSLWAAGWRMRQGTTEPWILRRDGTSWQTQPVEPLGDGHVVLTDLDVVSTGHAWASGYWSPADDTRLVPLLLRWDGSSWTRVQMPWAERGSFVLHGVTEAADGSLLLEGARVAHNDGRNRAFVARFVEGTWTRGLAPTSRYHNSELTDGAWLEGGPILVGVSATWSVIVTGCAPGPRRPTRDSPSPDPASNVPDTGAAASTAPGSPAPGLSAPASPAPPKSTPASTVPSMARERAEATAAARGARRETRTGTLAGRPARSVRFRDVARRAGLAAESETWGAIAADFDADGRTDIYYGRHNRLTPMLMLAGPRGRFTRTASGALRLRDRHGCAAADVDADGRLDLFCSVGANRGTNMTSHELWLAIGTRERQQRTADYGVNDPFGRGRTATFIHLDADRYPELFVANEPQRSDALPSHDRLYVNDAGRRFLSAPQQGLDRSMGGTCATAGDVDADGDEDLIVCASEAWGGLPRGIRIFENAAGRLRHATRSLGVRPIGDVDALVADFDGDGQVDDLARLGSGGLRVSVGSADGQALVYRRAVTFGVNLAAGDVDGDGRQDLYVQRGGSGNQPDLLLVNRRQGRAWVSQRIPQTRAGLADDVVALDHDRNGLDDFFVTNGRMSRGPVQLIAAYRR